MKLRWCLIFLICSNVFSANHTCNDILLEHKYYKTCFNSSKKLARWVSYKLSEDMFRGNARRSNKFSIDPLIPKLSPKPKHYQGSGFDRGHLAPAGDMNINQTAMDQSFYMTNISAQEPSFNRGIWKKLENLIRNLTEANKVYEVVTGPVFKFKKKSFNSRYLNVPQAFYKIIFYQDKFETKVLAFLIPNKKSNESLTEFLIPVNTIEALTGIDFFQELPDNVENVIEAQVRPQNWGL